MTTVVQSHPNGYMPTSLSSLGRVCPLGDVLKMRSIYYSSPVFDSGVLVRISEYVSPNLVGPRQWNAKKPVYIVVSKIVDNRVKWGELSAVGLEIWGLDPRDDAETLAQGAESLQEKQRLMVKDSSFAEERRTELGEAWDRIVPIRTIELLVSDYFQYLNGPKEINGMPLDQRFPLPSLAHCLSVCEPNSIHRRFQVSGNWEVNPNSIHRRFQTSGNWDINPRYIADLNAYMYSEAEKVHRQLNGLPEPKQVNFPVKNAADQEAYRSGHAKIFFPQRTKEQEAEAARKKDKQFDSAEQDLTEAEYAAWVRKSQLASDTRHALIEYVRNRNEEAEQYQVGTTTIL